MTVCVGAWALSSPHPYVHAIVTSTTNQPMRKNHNLIPRSVSLTYSLSIVITGDVAMFKAFGKRAVALTGSLAALSAAMVLMTPSAALASPFCNVVLGPFGACVGSRQTLSGASGIGFQGSVCIGIGGMSGPCSAGAGRIATLALGRIVVAAPSIRNNISANNSVSGDTF